jgi:hypothetical protein
VEKARCRELGKLSAISEVRQVGGDIADALAGVQA